MKNFTNNFKQFTSRLSVRWLLIAFMFLLGTSSAWAYDFNNSTIYLDLSAIRGTANFNLTTPHILIGHNTYSSGAGALSLVSGTKNLYKKEGLTWGGAYDLAFINDSWNGEGNKLSNRLPWAGNYKGTEMTNTLGNGYLYIASTETKTYTSGNTSSILYKLTSRTSLPTSLAVTIQNYVGSTQTANAGTITIKKWNSTDYTTSFLSSAATSSSSTTGYLTALKVTATPKTGYELVSLTVGGTAVSSGYEFEITAATTIVATWKKSCSKNPTSDDFSFTAPNNLYYSGNNMSATVNWKNAQDKGGEISIFYSSDENTFIEATPNLPGTYYVFITAAADGDFCDLNTKTKVGSFTIKGNDLDNANIYFDNSKGKWTSAPKLHIGNLGKNGAYYSMSLVSGTRYLYAKTGLTFEDYVAWFFTPHGDGGSENIQTNYNTIETKSGYNVTPIKYIDETPALTTNKIYGTNGNDGDIYNLSTPIDYSTKKLNIDISGEGTVVIKNNAGTTLNNENEYPYLTYLKSIKATPSVGYELESIKINGIDYTDAYENGANTDNGYDMVADANVTITFAEGCTLPNVQISNLSSTTLCTGGSLTFNYTAVAGANVTFKMGTNPSSFTVTGGGSNSGTVTIKYNSNTTINSNPIKYDVSGTDICALTGQSTGTTINCGPKPSIAATSGTSFSFCPGDDDVTLSVTAGQGTYKWTKNSEVIVGKTSNSIEVSEAGTYTVFVVGTGGCESNTVTFTVNGNGGPRVYASGSTTLGANKFAALYVTDCSGKEIDTYQWQSSSTQNGTYTAYNASVTNSGTLYSGDAGTTNNIRPATAGWYRCKVTYTDGSSLTSEAKQVTGTFTRLTSTLPVIIVNTNGVGFPVNNTCQTPSAHADDMKAKRSVDVKIYQGNTMVYDRKARMNYRGSSSLNFLKKSYAFCPGKDNCVEDKGRLDYVKTEKMNMLGIGEASDKDWVLYAAAADPSLMRNRLMFDTFRDMTGGWSVNSRYVELYVDGEYKGVYVMMDKVTKNEGRVNITDPNGFIVKFDKTDLVDRYEADGDKKTFKSLYSGYDGESGNGMKTYDTYIDQRFEIEYPEMKDVEEDNPGMWAKTVNDIRTLFNNFESNLKAGNYAEVQKIIDYISWADWFIISEYAKNMDAYRASCLFVYNGGKIKARPLWDQELSFSNTCANLCDDYNCNSTEGLLIENSTIYTEGCAPPFWFTGKYVGGRGTEAKDDAQFEGYLLNDPCFIAVLKERWAKHVANAGALTKNVLGAKISTYEADLGAIGTTGTPLNREKNFWSGKSRSDVDKSSTGDNCFTGTTGYEAYNTQTLIGNSATSMKNWVNGANGDRRTKLGALIEAMEGSPLSISFAPQEVTTTPWEPITLQIVNTSSYDYTITYTDGELDKQSGVIINKTDDTFKINVPRPDDWGIGDEKVEGERVDITYGIKATLNVADGTTVCGNNEVTPATATIILKDEDNEDCD